MKIKISLFILTIIIACVIIIFSNQKIKKIVYQAAPEKLQVIYKVIFRDKKFYTMVGNNKVQNFRKDYNARFLPETQLIKIDFLTKHMNFPGNFRIINKKNLPLLKEFKTKYQKGRNEPDDYKCNYQQSCQIEHYYKYFIEKFKNKTILVSDNGVISELQNKKLLDQNEDSLTPKVVESNLPKVLVLDIYVYEDTLFVSAIDKDSNCLNVTLDQDSNMDTKDLFGSYIILSSKINSKFYDFKNFYKSGECGKNIMGGRMKFYDFNGNKGLLFTTSDSFRINGTPNEKSQSLESIYGKTVFIDFKDRNISIYSIGHRNAQGLFVEDDLILETEHGPRGGDEINKIMYNKNYGWPYSTYGTVYPYNTLKEPKYKKNHSLGGYEEPIFSYVPSIGISEIIKVPNTFYPNFWQDNFLISSLRARSLFRVKFDDNYTKILFNEKILIGERIRDIMYLDELNLILLSLENSKLGILKK